MKTYLLIWVGDLYINEVWLFNANNKQEFIEFVNNSLKQNEDSFIEKQRLAIYQMLFNHNNWDFGQHILNNIDPIWERLELVITSGNYSSVNGEGENLGK